MSKYLEYTGTGRDAATVDRSLPRAPTWREFTGPGRGADFRSRTFQASTADIEMVNAALYLRRPLLVTGKPGTGKSSLAHSVAWELGLGSVLQWPITSRSSLKDGQYRYDAVARLQDTGLPDASGQRPTSAAELDIGRYVQLGPLGTAMLPADRPRVLVIDELDKSDIDLPNDLLTIFEEGWFEIPELARQSDRQDKVTTRTADPGGTAVIEHGIVRCREFPLVVITSNGERQFPPAFLRRCLRLEMAEPDEDKLAAIVDAHMPPGTAKAHDWLIKAFLSRRDGGELATDQLLNAVYLVHSGLQPETASRESLAELLLPYLDAMPG